jgi:hypothetical protein
MSYNEQPSAEPSTKFFVSPDGTTYPTTTRNCKGHTFKTYHCWHLEITVKTTLLFKCFACGKHHRKYKPGMKPANKDLD